MKQVILQNNVETTYYITEDGRLFNKKTNRWYKGTIRGGYLNYDLRVNNKRYACQAHRLVAGAYLPNPKQKPIVNHKDGNKLNNNINNLEWVTPRENLIHAYETNLKPKTNGNSERKKYDSDFPNEQWKQYKDTVYMISNKGRARNLKTNNLIKGKIRADGYIEWCFSIDKKKHSLQAHRIVYETFCGPINQDMVINHKDGNKTNNQLENLEEITRGENINHCYYTIKTYKRIRPVGKFTLNDELLQVYPSCAEAARQNVGCLSNYISLVCNNKAKTHHGYKWKYIDEE